LPADAQELALLLEVTELYCLVVPSPRPLGEQLWLPLMLLVKYAPTTPTQFAVMVGKALISLAEDFTQDLLQVLEGPSTTATDTGTASSSGSSSSSSESRRLRTGGGSPSVTLYHRLKWAQHVNVLLGALLARLQYNSSISSLLAGE
jgi:hypothetical protein